MDLIKKHMPIFIIWVLACSCVLFSRFHPGGAEWEKLREAKSTEEVRERFNSYPVDKQIDIYLFGLKYIEPDDSSAQEFLVNDGERKLPTIITSIQNSHEEFDKGYLMEVVTLINKDCNCVTDDQKERLYNIGGSLKNSFHRSRFQQAFDELNK
jgi:hypothetical protein